MNISIIAGTVSTILFGVSTFPMLYKAIRSRDMVSYSVGNLALSNLGNAVHSIYVYSLPFGPIWILHSFYVVSAALMLIWYVRFGTSGSCRDVDASDAEHSPDAAVRRRRPLTATPMRGILGLWQ